MTTTTRNSYTAAEIAEMKKAYLWYVANGMEKEGAVLKLTVQFYEDPAFEEEFMTDMYNRWKADHGYA